MANRNSTKDEDCTCDICGKTYSRSDNMKRHNAKHVQESQEPAPVKKADGHKDHRRSNNFEHGVTFSLPLFLNFF